MTITATSWDEYIAALRKVNDTAAQKIMSFLSSYEPWELEVPEVMREIVSFAYGVSTKYGEAAAELACEMYDAMGAATGLALPPALPAATASYGEVARTVYGTLKYGNDEIVSAAVGRLVKTAGVDTTMQNAIRDGAQWAWIPRGDTCAFCITLASQGWVNASKKALKNGHAEHIHANCDCTYAIRFNTSTEVEGYDPDEYLKMYEDAPGRNSKDKINSMRREFYAENKEEINAKKRDNYEKRKELNSSEAEETNV